ncbi:hypothetical protein Tco_0904429 [Tanacetum coccineum]
MVLEKDFAGFALQEMEIHPLMLLIRTLSMNLQAFSPTLHNPSTDHTHVNYVETTLIMVMIVLYGCRLGPHEDYQCQPWHQNYYELNPCYDSNSYGFDQPPQNSIDHQPQSIQEDLNQQRMNDVHHKWDDMIESKNELFQSLGEMLRQREQAANLSTHTLEPSRHFNSIYYDDDDEIISQIPPSIAITPVLPTLEPEDSLSMGDEHLSTIPEKESDEFIKSSVEDLVPIPMMPSHEPDLLVTPLSKLNEDECFDPGGDFVLEEIEACLTSDSILPGIDDDDFDPEETFFYLIIIKSDVSTDFEDDYYDLEGDIIYLESLLIKDNILNLPLEVFLDRDPRSLEDEPDNEDLKSMVKVFDPGIHEKKFSLTYVKLPFEDRHYLSLTYVI